MTTPTTEPPQTCHRLTSARIGRMVLVPIVLIGCLALTSCYQRVVKDSRGTHSGTIHEGNLPEESNGFWTDAFETSRVVPKEQSSEAQRIRQQNQTLYESQTKGLGRGSGNP